MAWNIRIITDTSDTINVIVPENCTGAELFETVKKHPKAPKVDNFTLTPLEADEIKSNSTKRLKDYALGNGAAVHITMKLPGGVWPTIDDLQATPRNLKATNAIRITKSAKHPDEFGLDDDSPRAVMSCGHAVAPLSLAMHCFYELEKDKDTIICPVAKCRSVWKFSQVFDAACLSENERVEFERRALLNKMRKKRGEIKHCFKCNFSASRLDTGNKRVECTNCTRRSGRNFEFCWICLREWKNGGTTKCGHDDCGVDRGTYKILATCPWKELNGVLCPSRRACPKCFSIIEHTKACKHMTCRGCEYEFCFICLEKYPCCSGDFFPCEVAARQTPSSRALD